MHGRLLALWFYIKRGIGGPHDALRYDEENSNEDKGIIGWDIIFSFYSTLIDAFLLT